MKKLILLFAISVLFISVNAKCICIPPSRYQFYGNYAYDSLSNTVYIYPGDTIHIWIAWACAGGYLEADNEFYLDDVLIHNPNSYALTPIYEPGHYAAKNCCCDAGVLFESRFDFNVAYSQALPVTNPSSSAASAIFIYSSAENSLIITAWNLNESPAALSIFDLQGNEVYHREVSFTSVEDKTEMELGNSLSAPGLYIARLQYGKQHFTGKLVRY